MFFTGIFSKGFPRILRLNFTSLHDYPHNLRSRFHLCLSISKNEPARGPGFSKEEDCLAETFDEQVERRRQEAQRSVLVQVHSEQSCAQLHEYCSQFGTVTSMHHYTVSNSSHFVLLEFNNKEVVSEVMKSSGYNDRSHIIPTYSHMLWFRNNQTKKLKSNPSAAGVPLKTSAPPLTRTQLFEWLGEADSVSDQIRILHESTRLDDLGTRLRYLTAHQLEAAVSGLFPQARALLFGSSVNGFGRYGCDLDLVLQLDHRSEQEDEKCRLMFHAKPTLNARSQMQRHVDGLADLVQWFLPGCTDVRRILLARVPIVKYRQELTDIECDLSLTNMTAVYMSELLYTFGALDWRVRPLVFTVKRWAAEVNLTNPSPGRWITNFSLTLLVIFYLQQVKILPSLDTLRQKAGKSDRRMSEDGVNCTFLRNVSKVKPSEDNSSLESLFTGFFEFYAAFDFATQGIALGIGSPIKKRDHSALYITNPLETHLNVSQNVSLEETERLKIEARNAAWELESSAEVEEKEAGSDWGLLCLFKENKLNAKAKQLEHLYFAPKRRTYGRLMPVSKLFEEESEQNNKVKNSRKEGTVVR